MYNNLRILGLIPARGGSKGIKNKNIIDLCGKPLISYTIEAGLSSKYIDDIVVTTDSPKIADISKQYGAEVPFLRPSEYATDHSKSIDAVMHAINYFQSNNRCYDLLILLQPTEPLRTATDIDTAIEELVNSNSSSLVSLSPVTDSPLLIRQIDNSNHIIKLLDSNSTVRRQDMQPYYVVNGCIYINYIKDLNYETSFNDNEYGFIMTPEHSVDIDELIDLEIAKYYIQNNK